MQTIKSRGYDIVITWEGIYGSQKAPLFKINNRLRTADYIEQILSLHVAPMFRSNNNIVDILACRIMIHPTK